MEKSIKYIAITVMSTFFVGCVPVVQPQLGTTIGGGTTSAPQSTQSSEFGSIPHNYATSIRNYFSTKLKRADKAQYKFSEPKRAYKRKGFAYGGDVDWKGWLVETSVAIPSRTGRLYLTPKPYMVLFKGNQIVEHILGTTHSLVVKVDK